MDKTYNQILNIYLIGNIWCRSTKVSTVGEMFPLYRGCQSFYIYGLAFVSGPLVLYLLTFGTFGVSNGITITELSLVGSILSIFSFIPHQAFGFIVTKVGIYFNTRLIMIVLAAIILAMSICYALLMTLPFKPERCNISDIDSSTENGDVISFFYNI